MINQRVLLEMDEDNRRQNYQAATNDSKDRQLQPKRDASSILRGGIKHGADRVGRRQVSVTHTPRVEVGRLRISWRDAHTPDENKISDGWRGGARLQFHPL
jgi:hypothetical protein